MELINHYYRATIVNLEVIMKQKNNTNHAVWRLLWRMRIQCNDITLTGASQ